MIGLSQEIIVNQSCIEFALVEHTTSAIGQYWDVYHLSFKDKNESYISRRLKLLFSSTHLFNDFLKTTQCLFNYFMKTTQCLLNYFMKTTQSTVDYKSRKHLGYTFKHSTRSRSEKRTYPLTYTHGSIKYRPPW